MPAESTVLRDHYYRLASEVPQERISAASGLISELTKANDEGEWKYALDRLIKGLSTTRQNARFGFSMALAELLRELIQSKSTIITTSSFYDRIVDATQVKSSMKGKEERAILFGRLFGLQALLNSGSITDENAVVEEQQTFVTLLMELATKKPWLRETAIFTLCSFIKQLLVSHQLGAQVVRHIFRQLTDLGLTLTSEGIAVYLSIPTDLRSVSQEITNSSTWKNGDPLTKGNLPVLARTLKEVGDPSTDNSDENKGQQKVQQKSSWTQRLPFVWDLVLHNLIELTLETETLGNDKKRSRTSSKSSKKRKVDEHTSTLTNRITLNEFWTVVVDEAFFSDKSSPERKYWGFEIFCKFVAGVNAEQLPTLFSPNFMRCLINQSAHSNRLLHKMASRLLDHITDVSKDLFKAPSILSSLLNESMGGCWNFDLVTKTKTVDSIITSISTNSDAQAVSHFASEVRIILNAQFEDAVQTQEPELLKRSESKQKWVLDKYLLLIRSTKQTIASHQQFAEDILKQLVKNAFFEKEGKTTTSDAVHKTCQERVNSILAELISVPRKKGSWPLLCVEYIRKLQGSNNYQILSELEGELATVADSCYEKIKEVNQLEKSAQNSCLELMFSMVYIQLYMGDTEAVSTFEDLIVCYEKMQSSSGDSSSAIILTEIVLSFVSRRSSLLKKLSMMIWDTFLCTPDENGKILADSSSMKLLYDILTAKENKEGQQQLFEGEEEYENEEEGTAGDDEEDSEEENDAESDSDSDEQEDNTEITEVDKTTNKKLAAALGILTETSGEVKFSDLSDDSDGSDGESDSMDDEQMMEMDDQLSKIFKERKDALDNVVTGNKRKAEVVEAKEQMTFFKNRALDLLELFVRKQPDSALVLTMIEPLVILIGLTMDKAISAKAHKLMKSKFNKCKITNFDAISTDPKQVETYLIETLSKVHGIATKSKTQTQTLACNQAGLLIAKALTTLDEANIQMVIDFYCTTMKNWAVQPKNKIQASMFFDFINWINSKRK